MSTSATATLLRHLRQWAAGRGDDPHSDRELLHRFAAHRDEDAFAALVRRHGPMVWSMCRRILPQLQDAEDAFQATFLVLLRRAAAAFSPNGRTVAISADPQAAIRHFDVPTGKEVLRLRGHDAPVDSLAFSPDGTKLASGQWDSTALIWDVSLARRKLPKSDLTKKDLERLWADLRAADAAKAYAALWTLVADPEKTVPFLKQHLHPVPRVAEDRLRRLIADLDADEFARREQASSQLAKLGSEVEPALRKALENKPSLEMRRRVESLLKDLACQTEMTPDALRQLRAIQVLEQIGSSEARNILKSLAQGAPAAPATRDAAAALQRLK